MEWLHALKKGITDRDIALNFARLDRNDDGAISREEFKIDPPKSIANAFDAIDLNGNGELGPEEFLKAVSQPPDEIDIPKEVTRHFGEIDRNRDQVLGLREFVRHLPPQPPPNAAGFQPPPPEKLFKDLDINQDGEVSLIEFYQRRFPNGFPQNAR